MSTDTNQTEAVGSPVERPVRPCAWKCSTCANTSDYEGATAGDNWCSSCGTCGTMQPLYDQGALNADVAAERERLALLAESRTDGWHSLTADEIRRGAL